jgi:hypothetical protein
MTLTIENLPVDVEHALRERATAEHKSLKEAVVDALARGLGVSSSLAQGGPLEPAVIRPLEEQRRVELADVVGTWESDPETEAILEEQNRIDPEMWK